MDSIFSKPSKPLIPSRVGPAVGEREIPSLLPTLPPEPVKAPQSDRKSLELPLPTSPSENVSKPVTAAPRWQAPVRTAAPELIPVLKAGGPPPLEKKPKPGSPPPLEIKLKATVVNEPEPDTGLQQALLAPETEKDPEDWSLPAPPNAIQTIVEVRQEAPVAQEVPAQPEPIMTAPEVPQLIPIAKPTVTAPPLESVTKVKKQLSLSRQIERDDFAYLMIGYNADTMDQTVHGVYTNDSINNVISEGVDGFCEKAFELCQKKYNEFRDPDFVARKHAGNLRIENVRPERNDYNVIAVAHVMDDGRGMAAHMQGEDFVRYTFKVVRIKLNTMEKDLTLVNLPG